MFSQIKYCEKKGENDKIGSINSYVTDKAQLNVRPNLNLTNIKNLTIILDKFYIQDFFSSE